MPARYGDDLAAELTEASAFVPSVARTISRKWWRGALGISLPVAAVGGEPRKGGRTFAT